MTIEKLRPTYTFTQERLAALQAVVPEAFADGRINWERLREALGDYLEAEEADAEHFGLTWPGKRAARRLAATPSPGTLRPAPGEGIDEATTRNLFIEGDNLEVLKLLQKSYAGRVKLIYIDPPYNTGNDFIYKDDFSEPLASYLRRTGQTGEEGELLTTNPKAGGRFHSNWLNMMYPRLLLAKHLLRDDGVIFVSIDDNEIGHLVAMMDEIFGPENAVATIIWQRVFAPKNTAKHFSADHDYIVVYARSGESWQPNLLPRSDEALGRYQNFDNDVRGMWSSDNLLARNYYSKGEYEVTSPAGKKYRNPTGTYWRVSYEKFLELDQDSRIWWGENKGNMPRLKRFLNEVKQGVVPQTIWQHEMVGHTQEAKKELLHYVSFEHNDNVFDTPKPVRLIQKILQIATVPEDNDIVVDFFGGSSSTAHAVLKQNREDNGNRSFLLVQIPSQLPIPETTLKTIADIGKERIRRVSQHMKQEDAGKLLTERETPEDLGFKVFKLGRSHFKSWSFDTVQEPVDERSALPTLFDAAESPLVDGWQPDDLLVEILLQEGFPLDSRITVLEFYQQNWVWQVESEACAHRLFVCLDDRLHAATIAGAERIANGLFICLDTALSDEEKLRLADHCRLKVI